jgi:ADP-ribose pyrophosphatase YjhB (NUDIX family)
MTDSNPAQRPRIRAAAILIENGRILLVKQEVSATRHWSLPGCKLDWVESLEQCLIREMKEETGLDIRVKELAYITDRIKGNDHLVRMTFLVELTGTGVLPDAWQHTDPFPSDSCDAVREVKMVPISEMKTYGFPPKYCRLAQDNFPGRGSYQGSYFTFYGEQ